MGAEALDMCGDREHDFEVATVRQIAQRVEALCRRCGAHWIDGYVKPARLHHKVIGADGRRTALEQVFGSAAP